MLPTFIRLYEVFYKKYFLDFFQNYEGKTFNGDLLQWRYYPVSCNILLKKRFLRRYIPVNFETFFRITLLENSCELLLLYDEEIQNAYWVHCIVKQLMEKNLAGWHELAVILLLKVIYIELAVKGCLKF